MKWIIEEQGRLVKAWNASEVNKAGFTSCLALAPQKTFWIATKVGFLHPSLAESLPPNLAEKIAARIEDNAQDHLSFEQIGDILERNWCSLVAQDEGNYLAEIEIILVQNLIEGLEETKRAASTPLSLAHA